MAYDSYDAKELEKKQKTMQNYWAFAYAKYCREQEKEIEKNLLDTFDTLEKTFASVLRKEDEDPARIEKARQIIDAVIILHNELKTTDEDTHSIRKELDQYKETDSVDERAAIIKKAIKDYCEKFTTSYDKAAIAHDGPCLLEYLNAMFDEPELAAKVDLDDKQLAAASRIAAIGMVIKDGMEAMEEEFTDAVSREHKIDDKQHEINLAKISKMDLLNEQRLKGDMRKELEDCNLLTSYAKEDRLELAAKLIDPKRRMTMMKPAANKTEKKIVTEKKGIKPEKKDTAIKKNR